MCYIFCLLFPVFSFGFLRLFVVLLVVVGFGLGVIRCHLSVVLAVLELYLVLGLGFLGFVLVLF